MSADSISVSHCGRAMTEGWCKIKDYHLYTKLR